MKTKRVILLLLALLGVTLVQSAQAFYNPSTGRWLSRDPIGEEGGLNIYSFVSGDPINKFDNFGLASSTTPGNGLPGADDILALYQANTQIHWLCNNCCGRGTSTR